MVPGPPGGQGDKRVTECLWLVLSLPWWVSSWAGSFLGSGSCLPCWRARPLPGAEPALLGLGNPLGTPQDPISFLALEWRGPCPGVCLPLHPERENNPVIMALGSPPVEEQNALSFFFFF